MHIWGCSVLSFFKFDQGVIELYKKEKNKKHKNIFHPFMLPAPPVRSKLSVINRCPALSPGVMFIILLLVLWSLILLFGWEGRMLFLQVGQVALTRSHSSTHWKEKKYFHQLDETLKKKKRCDLNKCTNRIDFGAKRYQSNLFYLLEWSDNNWDDDIDKK